MLGLILLALQKLAWDFLMTTCGQCHMFAAHPKDGISPTAMPPWNHFRVGKQKLRGQTGQRAASSEAGDIFDVEPREVANPSAAWPGALTDPNFHVPSLSSASPQAFTTQPDEKGLCPFWRWGILCKAKFFIAGHTGDFVHSSGPNHKLCWKCCVKPFYFLSSMCCVSDSHSIP